MWICIIASELPRIHVLACAAGDRTQGRHMNCVQGAGHADFKHHFGVLKFTHGMMWRCDQPCIVIIHGWSGSGRLTPFSKRASFARPHRMTNIGSSVRLSRPAAGLHLFCQIVWPTAWGSKVRVPLLISPQQVKPKEQHKGQTKQTEKRKQPGSLHPLSSTSPLSSLLMLLRLWSPPSGRARNFSGRKCHKVAPP